MELQSVLRDCVDEDSSCGHFYLYSAVDRIKSYLMVAILLSNSFYNAVAGGGR